MQVNASSDEKVGLSNQDINKIKNIEGIEEVKTARVLQSRLVLPKKDLLEKDFIKELDNEIYVKDVLNGSLIDDKINDTYLMKQKLKGYNDEMLKSLDDYLVSGKIDIDKMKKENLVVVYMPYIYDDNGMKSKVLGANTGSPLANINVGDTVTIKYPKGKIKDVQAYWQGKDNYEYENYTFRVGAIVNYPYADDNMYTADDGIDVIASDKYLDELLGNSNYDVVYANMNENHKAINEKLGEIGSTVPGTITTDMTEDKAINEQNLKQKKLLDFGVVAVMFAISVFNIINNVSYNLTSRTSEFGMLRAIGITDRDLRKMITYEGLFYGAISSVIVVVVSLLIQIRMYKTFGFETYGLDFEINYMLYILIVLANIIVGLLATYLPARRIKESSIVEAINIIE